MKLAPSTVEPSTGRPDPARAAWICRRSGFAAGRILAWLWAWLAVWLLTSPPLARGEAAPASLTPSAVSKRVTAYALTSANDRPDRDPRDWRLSGSSDGGTTWTPLDARKGEVFRGRLEKRVFTLAQPLAFPRFRLEIDSVLEPIQANSMQVAEIELIGNLEGIGGTGTNRWFEQIVAHSGGNAPSESADKAFDGLAESKWLHYATNYPQTRASWVQWQYVSGDTLVLSNIGQLLGLPEKLARAGCAVRIPAIVLGLNPRTGTVCLSDRMNNLWLRRASDASAVACGQRVTIEGKTTYTNAQPGLLEPRLRLAASPPAQPRQLRVGEPVAPSEDMLWVETEGTVRFVAQRDQVDVLELEDGQGRMKARFWDADAAGLIRYLNQRIKVRGLLEPAYDERGERAGGDLWVGDDTEIALAPPTAAEWHALPAYSIRALTQSHRGQPAKALTHYALTSANDYPERDPREWRLLGSNDGGKAWTTLDTRRNESFANRFQRREFTLTNPAAFNLFRLWIDAIQPSREVLLQLAEIELIGAPDTEAEFAAQTERVITALGELPPTETSEMAFDGSADTKWLHLATNSWIQAQYAWVHAPSNRVIKVRGRLVAQEPGKSLHLEAGGARIEVRSPQVTPLTAGTEVEAAGFLDREAQNPVLTGAFFRIRRDPAMTEIAKPTAVTTVLTKVGQILRLSRGEQARRMPARIRGVVTCNLSGDDYTQHFKTIQDETGGIVLNWGWSEPCQPGEYVEIEGVVEPWASAPMLSSGRSELTRRLGRGSLPRPAHPSWDALRTGKPESQWIELRGVVRSVEKDQFTLMVPGGQLPVRVGQAPASALARWVDATVAVRGVYRLVYNKAFQIQYFILEAPSLECVQVEKTAPLDPFGGQVQAITNLLRSDSGMALPHRAKIAGVVTYADQRTCYVQDAAGVIKAELRDPTPVEAGDQVEVVGLPEPGGYAPVFAEALIRKIGTAALPPPIELTRPGLLSGEHHARRVRLAASVLKQKAEGPAQVLELQAEPRTFRALLATRRGPLPAIPAGSRVAVTGVCLVGSGKPTDQGVLSFELLMATPADVLVKERPPWWDRRRIRWLVGLLFGGLALAGAWIAMIWRKNRMLGSAQTALREARDELEVRVMERTAELAGTNAALQLEMAERKQAQAQLETASRQAGMAEVATSVLHNVGNVLNSVNTSVSVLEGRARVSHAADVVRLAGLLEEHRTNLAEFLTRDQRADKIVAYLRTLGQNLASGQTALLEEIKDLTGNVDHIKDIVSMQQGYAMAMGVTEVVALADMVDSALAMQTHALLRHDVQVVREYDPRAPAINVEKHKLLQILVNLIQNAKNACDESGRGDKRLTLRVTTDAQRVFIAVIDNGVGIPAENLTKIFQHGFTTRPNGHGFGLHSAALAARAMHGALRVHSDGRGRGACFTLELPRQTLEPPVGVALGPQRISP